MLSKQQEKLRGKKIIDMTNDELIIWLKACVIMENQVKGNKARRSWTSSYVEAELELEKRNNN